MRVIGALCVREWCEGRDSNPHAYAAPEPKSGASTNSATFALSGGILPDPLYTVSQNAAISLKSHVNVRWSLREFSGRFAADPGAAPVGGANDLLVCADGRRFRRRGRRPGRRTPRAAGHLSHRAPRDRKRPSFSVPAVRRPRRGGQAPPIAASAVPRSARRIQPRCGENALRLVRRGARLLPPLRQPHRTADASPLRRSEPRERTTGG